jgi:hypothetical protein
LPHESDVSLLSSERMTGRDQSPCFQLPGIGSQSDLGLSLRFVDLACPKIRGGCI